MDPEKALERIRLLAGAGSLSTPLAIELIYEECLRVLRPAPGSAGGKILLAKAPALEEERERPVGAARDPLDHQPRPAARVERDPAPLRADAPDALRAGLQPEPARRGGPAGGGIVSHRALPRPPTRPERSEQRAKIRLLEWLL
jgi:hypothetical protein